MRPHRRHATLIALIAALAQLWLNAAMAGAGAAYCGDGGAGRSASLLAQLPPELRLPLPALDDVAQADCDQCAPLCCPALPTKPSAFTPVPVASFATAETAPAAPELARVGRLPPARGPPKGA